MNQELPAPWMLGATKVNDIPMLVCHMSNGELEGLDDLQGGPSVDESTGIREYSALAEIVEIPEIKELFHTIVGQAEKHGGRLPLDVREAYKEAKDYSLPYRETEEEKHDPLRALERKGRHGDSKLAELPVNLVELLIELEHVPSTNPETGLLEFWALNKLWKGNLGKEILRAVGTIGGAILGGPIGAGAGNTLAGVITGKSLPNAAMSGLKTGAMTYGAQGLGQLAGLSGATPYTAGFFGGNNMLANGLGGLGKMAGIGPKAAAAASVAGATAPGWHAPMAPLPEAPTAEPGFMSHILGGLGKYAIPIGGMAGLSYMGSRQHQKHQDRERERQEAKWAKERQQMGWETNWTPVASKKYEPNPEFFNRSEEDIRHGRIHAPAMREIGSSGKYAKGGPVQSYKEGTLVRGKGKGQDDFIKTRVPDGSYIWDASVTSMLGDGSSDAGAKVIKSFEQHIRNKVPKKIIKAVEREVKTKSQQVPLHYL